MADSPDLSDLVRRTMEANARLYQGWIDLSVEYFRGLSEVFSGVQSAVGSAASPDTESVPGAVVLEGEDRETAAGAFLVTNDLGRPLKCSIVASGFADADGTEAPARIGFDPASFELAPGEQQVVRATVPIDPKLVAGAAYTGTFGIEGMQGFSVPAVLRRRHPATASPIDRAAAAEERDAEASGGKGRAKKTAAKGTAKKTAAKKGTAKKKTTAKKASGKTSSAKKGATKKDTSGKD